MQGGTCPSPKVTGGFDVYALGRVLVGYANLAVFFWLLPDVAENTGLG